MSEKICNFASRFYPILIAKCAGAGILADSQLIMTHDEKSDRKQVLSLPEALGIRLTNKQNKTKSGFFKL